MRRVDWRDGHPLAVSLASVRRRRSAGTFHYTAKLDRDTYVVKGTATTSMTDFGIKPPVYLGVAVKPEIGITVSFSAKDS